MQNNSIIPVVYSFIMLGQNAIKLKSLLPFSPDMQRTVEMVLESLFIFGNLFDDYIDPSIELSDEEKQWLRDYRDEILMNWFGPVGISKMLPNSLRQKIEEYHKSCEQRFSILMNSLQPQASDIIQQRAQQFMQMQQAFMKQQQIENIQDVNAAHQAGIPTDKIDELKIDS